MPPRPTTSERIDPIVLLADLLATSAWEEGYCDGLNDSDYPCEERREEVQATKRQIHTALMHLVESLASSHEG